MPRVAPLAPSLTRTVAIGVFLAAAAILTGGGSKASATSLLIPTVSGEARDSSGKTVTTVIVGSTVHPYVKVTGSGGTPTGDVEIFRYTNGTCSGLWKDVTSEPLANGALNAYYLTDSLSVQGYVAYKFHYLGDGVYAAADSACAPVLFSKGSPGITLDLHNAAHHDVTSISYGNSVHAYVAVTGAGATPTGTVSINRFPSGTCSGTPTTIGPTALAADGTLDSSYQWTFPGPGTWSFRAYYSGSNVYVSKVSDCVSFSVVKATPTFVTSLHDASHGTAPASVMVGDVIHAYAILTSTVGIPTGTVKVYRYADGTCSAIENPQTITASTLMDPAGQALTWAMPRTESWRLTYSGDSLFAQVVGPCLPISWKAAPTIDAHLHNAGHKVVSSVVAGSPIHLETSVASIFGTPAGTVTFRVSKSNDCTSSKAFGSKALSSGVADSAATSYTPASAGTYSFEAVYGGSSSYTSVTSSCLVLAVTAAPSPTPTATPTPAPTLAPTSAPSVAPSVAPSAAPSPSAVPSEAPTASASPEASTAPTSTTAPSQAPVASAGAAAPSASPVAAGQGSVADPAANTGLPSWLWILLLLVLIAAALLIGWRWATRKR